MSKFITGKELEETIYDIIWETESQLLIVSPYIKLDNCFKDLFNKHKNNPKINILLVFGKNENAVRKSMSENDFDYFKEFPNVSIIYVHNLHAKYYGNENKGVITSINLYDYSFKNNIEFGVYSEQTLFSKFRHSTDNDAWNECMDIAHNGEVVFIKRPVYRTIKILINLGRSYVKSETMVDLTDRFYGDSTKRKIGDKKLDDFPEELDLGSKVVNKRKQDYGFCIRSGEKIKFNPKQPMSKKSWKVWSEYGNYNYPEKYCHKTGRRSFGKTSMNKPIM